MPSGQPTKHSPTTRSAISGVFHVGMARCGYTQERRYGVEDIIVYNMLSHHSCSWPSAHKATSCPFAHRVPGLAHVRSPLVRMARTVRKASGAGPAMVVIVCANSVNGRVLLLRSAEDVAAMTAMASRSLGHWRGGR